MKSVNHFKPLKTLKCRIWETVAKNNQNHVRIPNKESTRDMVDMFDGTTTSVSLQLARLPQVFLPEFQFLLCRRPWRPCQFGIVQKGTNKKNPFHGTDHELNREFGVHRLWWQALEKREPCCGFFVGPHVKKALFESTKRHWKTVSWTRQTLDPTLQTHLLFRIFHHFSRPAIHGPNIFSNEMLENRCFKVCLTKSATSIWTWRPKTSTVGRGRTTAVWNVWLRVRWVEPQHYFWTPVCEFVNMTGARYYNIFLLNISIFLLTIVYVLATSFQTI